MSHSDIAARWVAFHDGHASRLIGTGGSHLYATADALYSYGSHFPLVVPIREADGTLVAYLLNGDRYSVSTTRHQSIVRDAIAGSHVPSLIVPFSAIAAASVVRDSIRIVEARPDGLVRVPWKCTEPHNEYNDEHGNQLPRQEDGTYSYWCTEPGTRHVRREHRLGDSVFTASIREHYGMQTTTREHVRFISSFDYQEPRALYFLAELPANSYAESVDDALRDLRPEYVLKADDDGRQVVRQGDMFAVEPLLPMSRRMLREAGAVFARRHDSTHAVSLYGTAHTATEVATMPNGIVWARGMFRHEPRSIGEWRDADHVRRRILDGKAWARIVPNTVPRATNGTLGGRDVAAPRAWTIAGRVD